MSFHKRPSLKAAAAALALLLLAACGAQTKAPAPTPAPAPAAGASGTSKVKQPIMFAELDWDSAQVHNALARFIIEKGYGYQTDAIPGSTIPMMQGLGRGDIHIEMENWENNVKEAWQKLEKEGKVVTVGVNFPDAIQGFFVPTYMIKGDPARGIKPMTPDLKSVSDLNQYWQLFKDPENPVKGRFYDCIAGWACEKINGEKLKAYGLDEHFNRFLPGTGTALATSIAAAYTKGEPWVGYYWGPTWVLGKYDMTQLQEPAWTQECWDTTKACAYAVEQVTIAVSKEFSETAPDLMAFLKKYRTSEKMVSQMLAYMQDNKAEAKDAAINFLKTQPDVWTQWVPAEVATKVKAALS